MKKKMKIKVKRYKGHFAVYVNGSRIMIGSEFQCEEKKFELMECFKDAI
jgi:hypothetical protein